jgi:hypothetical protein
MKVFLTVELQSTQQKASYYECCKLSFSTIIVYMKTRNVKVTKNICTTGSTDKMDLIYESQGPEVSTKRCQDSGSGSDPELFRIRLIWCRGKPVNAVFLQVFIQSLTGCALRELDI